MRLNLLLLLLISFLPFPPCLVADRIPNHEAMRAATAILGINLLLVRTHRSAMWRYGIRRRLVRPDADDEEVRTLTLRLTAGLAGYVGLILLGLLLPLVAVLVTSVIALIFIIPIRPPARQRQ